MSAKQPVRRDEQQDRGRRLPAVRDPWDRFFDLSTWDPMRFWRAPFPAISPMDEWMPDIDLSESDDTIFVEIDVAGYDPKDINVNVANNVLTVTGKMEESAPGERKWTSRERRTRAAEFTRQVTLPDYADGAKASCKIKNGILTASIPKKPDAAPKQIPVKVE